MSYQIPEKQDSTSKKSIRIPDLLKKSREKQIYMNKKKEKSQSIDIEYGTDSKKCSNNNSYYGELEQMKAIMQSCNTCLEKMSQFKTKKPEKKDGCDLKKEQKSTQTVNKPFLIDLIQERISELCRQNRKLTKILINKEQEINQKQSQLIEIEQKFTNILYTLGQELSELKLSKKQAEEMQSSIPTDTETPAYLKALMMDPYL